MDLALNYSVLVAEEFWLINYELKVQLKKHGFTVIENQEETPDFIITCLSALRKTQGKENIVSSLLLNNPNSESTDTIVFDSNMQPLIIYPKPFNSNDIIEFILHYLNLNLTPNQHENN